MAWANSWGIKVEVETRLCKRKQLKSIYNKNSALHNFCLTTDVSSLKSKNCAKHWKHCFDYQQTLQEYKTILLSLVYSYIDFRLCLFVSWVRGGSMPVTWPTCPYFWRSPSATAPLHELPWGGLLFQIIISYSCAQSPECRKKYIFWSCFCSCSYFCVNVCLQYITRDARMDFCQASPPEYNIHYKHCKYIACKKHNFALCFFPMHLQCPFGI